MICKNLIFAATIWTLGAVAAAPQTSSARILPLDAEITADGKSIKLNWFNATPPRVGAVTINRRLYGQTGGESWQTLAAGLGPVMSYTDETVRPGAAYEYQVLRSAHDIVDVGYWLAGINIPAQDRRGTAHLVIDETIIADLAPWLERFEQDLNGDGWQVTHYFVPRGLRGHSTAQIKKIAAIKTALHNRYTSDPFGRHAIILIGHVPIVLSGHAGPDGHGQVPHPTDLFYAEMDGQWRLGAEGLVLENRVPSDFIETQIGRIDFFSVALDKTHELQLLRAYFDKNHHWRMGLLGDLREAYAGSKNLLVERAALRNVVGPRALVEGGHHNTGEEKPWLWGVDFGDYNGGQYAEKYTNKAVFTINFGSGKQRFDRPRNPMVALLAQPWYTIATGWGARPAWWLHHMALGGTIGELHQRTVNNGRSNKPHRDSMDYFPTGEYLWRNPIWVNLLGDPTTRPFMLAPPHGAIVTRGSQGAELSWQASDDPDTLGYRVYRARAGSGKFIAIAKGGLVEGLSFTDTAPVEGAVYIVRAYGLKQVYAGSFYTYSQGAFAANSATSEPDMAPDIMLTTPSDQTVDLPAAFNKVDSGKITALIEGPQAGTVTQGDTGWQYKPPAGFMGTVSLRYSVSNMQRTDEGRLLISVSGS